MSAGRSLMPRLPKDPNKMLICEIYQSIQGEGLQMGLPTVFVRVTGCPLRCRWCDEPRALTEGTVMTINDILEKVASFPPSHVCLTGGEPLAHKQVGNLIGVLVKSGYEVLVETSGSMSIEIVPRLPGVSISMDVKCPSSGMHRRMRFENIDLLSAEDQVKFVIADRKDYNYAREVLKEHQIPGTIILQPEGGTKMLPLVAWVVEDGLNVRVLPQLHKVIWGDKKSV